MGYFSLIFMASQIFVVWLKKNQFLPRFTPQGCAKDGTAPDGRSYIEAAETEEIRSLLK